MQQHELSDHQFFIFAFPSYSFFSISLSASASTDYTTRYYKHAGALQSVGSNFGVFHASLRCKTVRFVHSKRCIYIYIVFIFWALTGWKLSAHHIGTHSQQCRLSLAVFSFIKFQLRCWNIIQFNVLLSKMRCSKCTRKRHKDALQMFLFRFCCC